MIENPFAGPRPYRRTSDRSRFFGREDVSRQLESSILANRCVTVYGPSGAGKTSLMRASVLPELMETYEVRVVRVDGWPEAQDPTSWLASSLHESLRQGELPDGATAAEAVIASAKRAVRSSSRILLVYLDQVEQLFYPDRTAAGVDAFFDCLHELVDLDLGTVRIVISLREDYLGRFRDRLRDRKRLLNHGFRVRPMTVGELTEAVCKLAAVGVPPMTWSPDEMQGLMLQVRVPGHAPTASAEAQAAYAQIVCRALFQRRAGGAADDGDALDAEPILHGYLEESLARLGPLRSAAQWLLEEQLVSADGGRTLRTEHELLRLMPAGDLSTILRELEDAAILQAAEHHGSRYFEIGHDWLARRVFEQRQTRSAEQERELRERELARRNAVPTERPGGGRGAPNGEEPRNPPSDAGSRRRAVVFFTTAAISLLAVVATLSALPRRETRCGGK